MMMIGSAHFIRRFTCINFSLFCGSDDLVYSVDVRDLQFMLSYQIFSGLQSDSWTGDSAMVLIGDLLEAGHHQYCN